MTALASILLYQRPISSFGPIHAFYFPQCTIPRNHDKVGTFCRDDGPLSFKDILDSDLLPPKRCIFSSFPNQRFRDPPFQVQDMHVNILNHTLLSDPLTHPLRDCSLSSFLFLRSSLNSFWVGMHHPGLIICSSLRDLPSILVFFWPHYPNHISLWCIARA